MAFNVKGARSEGYSDAEIADYLATEKKFNIKGARGDGYSDTEIVDFLTAYEPEPSTFEKVKGAAVQAKDNIIAAVADPLGKGRAPEPQPGAVASMGYADKVASDTLRSAGPADPAQAANTAMQAEARQFVPVTVKAGQELEWLKQNNPAALDQLRAGTGKQAATADIAQGAASLDGALDKQNAENVAAAEAVKENSNTANLKSGFYSAAGGLYGAMAATAANLSPYGEEGYSAKKLLELSNKQKEWGKAIQSEASKQNFTDADSKMGWMVDQFLLNAPSTAVTLASIFSPATAPYALGAMASYSGGGHYTDLVNAGVDNGTATLAALGYGTVEAMIERAIPIEIGQEVLRRFKALDPLKQAQLGQRIARGVAAGTVAATGMAGVEGGEEAITGIIQRSIDQAVKQDALNKGRGDVAAKVGQEGVYDPDQIINDTMGGIAGGAPVAGAVGAVGGREAARSAEGMVGEALQQDVDATSFVPGSALGAGPGEADYRAATQQAFGSRAQTIKAEIEARKAVLRGELGTPAPADDINQDDLLNELGGSDGAARPESAEVAPQGGEGRDNLGTEGLSAAVVPGSGNGVDTAAGEPAPGSGGDLPAGIAGSGADTVGADEQTEGGKRGSNQEIQSTRDEPASDLRSMAVNGQQVPQQEGQAVQGLRGTRDNSVPGMAGEFRGVPEGHRGAPEQTALDGQDRQQSRVQPGQRSVGDDARAKSEQAEQPATDIQRRNDGSGRLGTQTGRVPLDASGANFNDGIGEGFVSPEVGAESKRELGDGAWEDANRKPVVAGNRNSDQHDPWQDDKGDVSRTGGDKAIGEVRGESTLSVGTTPRNAEPITVRNGVVFMGDYSAQNFESGEDVTVPSGADNAAIAQALRDAGVLSNRQRIYGLPKAPKAAAQPASPAVEVRKARNKRAAKSIQTADELSAQSRKTFLKAIKDMGGINPADARDVSGEPAHIANRLAPGLFRTEGNAIDLIARRLNELGYLSDADYNDVDGGSQAARDLIGQALAGEAVMTPAEQDRYRELVAKEQELAEGMPARNEALADAVEAEATQDDDGLDLDALPTMSEADAMRALGFTEEEINGQPDTQGGDSQAPEGTAEGRTAEGAEAGARQEGQEGFALEGQSPADVKAADAKKKADAEAKAKTDAEAEARAKADAERDSFTLTGSARAADANPGQEDIFSQPAPQAHKVGDMVKLTKPGVNGRINIAGAITRIMPDGRYEVRTQQDGYHIVAESELGHKPVQGNPTKLDAYTPPGTTKEASARWDYGTERGANQNTLFSAVSKALDAKLFYTREVVDFVAKELGVTDEQRKVGADKVEGGAFGYDVYHARQAVEKERADNANAEAGKRLGLKVGENIGKIKLQDGKIASAATVEAVSQKDVTFIAKRGPQTIRVTIPNSSIERYAEDAGNTYLKDKQVTPAERLAQAGPVDDGLFAEKPTRFDAAAASIDTELDAALKELADALKKQSGSLSSGVDPAILALGVKVGALYVAKGVVKFAQYSKAIIDALRAQGVSAEQIKPYLKQFYAATKQAVDDATFEKMDDDRSVRGFDLATLDEKGEENVTDQRSSTDLERDSQDSETQNGVGADGVRAGRGGDGEPGRQGVQDAEGAGRPGSGDRVSGRETAAAGERGNFDLFTGAPELSPGSAGNSVDQRGGDIGIEGAPVEPDAAGIIEELAESGLSKDVAKLKQKQADAKEHKPGLENIRETLPILHDGQHEDVHKAEQRFAKPDGYGMLFTNGTGTGKTFTALGIVKRFDSAGKRNILIVAPNDKIIEDWQKSGDLLGLKLGALENTNDSGKGIVITTYANMGQNDALASREWDLVVHDEAHYLAMDKDGTNTNALKALRAVSLHPDGAYLRAEMQNRALVDRMKELSDTVTSLGKAMNNADLMEQQYLAYSKQLDAAEKELKEVRAKWDAARDAVKQDVAARQGEQRPRVLFLSATPFAYEKTVDWANGYIFDYGNEVNSQSYNSGTARERFFMQHFGYRMRYNKLTEPDAKVDRGLMQRQFNTWLKKSGALSGRMLDVKADYDRRFVLVDSAIGTRIDEALQWFDDKHKARVDVTALKSGANNLANYKTDQQSEALSALRGIIAEKFDYLSRRYLLEAIKAREVIPHVREHLTLGRKVVVFHDYKKGGGFNPFNISPKSQPEGDTDGARTAALNAVIREFRKEFRDLIESDVWGASSPITAFQQEFKDALLFNGDVPKGQRRANVEKFQDDASGPQVILVQSAAGKEGISLHDTTGKHQRVLFNLGQPTQPTTAIQQEGRIYRTGQVTDAIFRYLNTGTNWEKWAFATTIATRASAAENLGMGEQARALKDAFIAGFEESGDYRAGMEGEGKGGKERDRAANEALTEYDRARAFYYGTQKKNSRTKAQEGADYFATPEPVGLKMMEWADIRPGESVLEPSAGHGAIARWAPDSAEKTAIEPSSALRPRLAMVFDGKIIDSTFEKLNVVNKYDAVVMNPPFGSGGKTAIDHVAKAATHLRDGGRIVALIPTGPAADKKFEKWFYEEEQKPAKPLGTVMIDGKETSIYKGDRIESRASWAPTGVVTGWRDGSPLVKADVAAFGGASSLVSAESIKSVEPTGQRTESYSPAANLYLVADIKLPQVTFERAGTAVATRVVVIEKQSDKDMASRIQQRNRDLSDETDINDLFDRLEDVTLRQRAKPVEDAQQEPAAEPIKPKKEAVDPVAAQAAASGMGLEIIEHTTGKGKVIRGVVRADLTKEQAKAIDEYTFKKDGGWFIREKHLAKFNSGETDAGTVMFSRSGSIKIKTDVPNEHWLKEQIDYAKSRPRTKYGVPYMGKITASFNGNPTVPVEMLASVKGERGEQDNVRREDLDWLKQELRANGLENVGAPYIEIGYDGVPWVSEGNHRIMAAQQLGWNEMPVEVRYFDGGERKAVRFAPDALIAGTGTKHEAVYTDPDASPEEIASVRALNRELSEYFGSDKHGMVLFKGRRAAVPRSISEAFRAAFGRRVVFVQPKPGTPNLFNGFQVNGSGDLYVNGESNVGFVQIAGHELWHHIQRTRPDLIDWYRQQSRQYYKNLPEYRDRLNALLEPGEKAYTDSTAESELEADFLGDSLADPVFMQQLVESSPDKFKQFMTKIRLWLAGVAQKLRGLGSVQHITDVRALQKHLGEVLKAYADGKPIADLKAPQFSRDTTSPYVAAWKMLAGDDAIFRNPLPDSFDMETAAKEIDPGMSAQNDPLDLEEEKYLAKKWYVKMPDGTHAYVLENKQGEVWLDASRLSERASGGTKLYLLVGSYAEGNGKVFIGDPAGLSDVALVRRTENMLSLALRFGKTDFMRPHEYQMNPHANHGSTKLMSVVRPISWVEGDDSNNIEELVKTSYANTTALVPEIKDVVYNFEHGRFWQNGREFTEEDFKAIAAWGYPARHQGGTGDTAGRNIRDAGGNADAGRSRLPVGVATLKRAAVTNAMARAARSGGRGGLLAEIGRVLPGGLRNTPLAGILYSRSQPPTSPTQPQQTPPPGGVSASVPAETRARRAQRIVQDQFNRFTVIQEWLRDNGVKLGNKHDVYRAEERMHGKIAAQIEDFRETRLQPLVVRIHKAGFNMQQIGEYLVANHAAERNAQIAKINPGAVDDNGKPNGSGMTDAEALDVLNRYAALPDFAKFEGMAEEFRAITSDTQRILLDAGIISKEMADAWNGAYKHYVPLRGGPADPGMGDATGKGVSVNARGERRRAMGHKARDEWAVENIIHAHERAIYLAEKNRVGQYLVSLAAAVPDSRLWTIDKPVKRKVLKPGQATFVVEHQGIAVGSFDTRQEAALFVTAMVTSANKTPSDFTVTRTAGDPQVAYMASGSLADNEVQIYVSGNTVRIQLNDPLLARAYKKMGQTHLVGILEVGRTVNAFLSKMYTGLNPEFIVTNVQRDLISGVVNITGEEGIGIAGKALKNWLPSLRDMLHYSMTGKASDWVRMYREDGGNTGAAYLSDLERVGRDVKTAYEEAVGVRQLFRESKPGKATRVAFKKSLHLVLGWIEHMNAAAENGMRVALYRSMVEAGKGRAAAAAAAKNSTVNFNRKGEIGAQLSALYLFANPAIQGTASMGHALFKGKHKGQAWALMGAMAGLAYLLALGYGDDDEWDEVPQYEKDRNMLIRVGDKVVKVAVPYGHGIAFALGNAIYDLHRGKDVTEAAYHMASSILENIAPLNPLGDKPDLKFAVVELAPFEPFRIFARVGNNTSGFQRQIMPESQFDGSRPDFLKAYRNTHGSVYDQLTRGMSKATGGTATQAGAIDVSPETLKFLFESATGGTGRFFMDSVQASRLAMQGSLPELQETPIMRKFVRDTNRVSDARARFWESVRKADVVMDDFRRAKNGVDIDAANRFDGVQIAGLSSAVEKYKDVSGQARDAVAAIKAMEGKTAAEKRLMIFEVERAERDLYRRMVKDIERRIGE